MTANQQRPDIKTESEMQSRKVLQSVWLCNWRMKDLNSSSCSFKMLFLRNNECGCWTNIGSPNNNDLTRGTKDVINGKGSCVSSVVYLLRRWGFQAALLSIQPLFIHNRRTTKYPALNSSPAKAQLNWKLLTMQNAPDNCYNKKAGKKCTLLLYNIRKQLYL